MYYQFKYHSGHLGLDPAGDTLEVSVKIHDSINTLKGCGGWSLISHFLINPLLKPDQESGWGHYVSKRKPSASANTENQKPVCVCTYKNKGVEQGTGRDALQYKSVCESSKSFSGEFDDQSFLGISNTKAIKMMRTRLHLGCISWTKSS